MKTIKDIICSVYGIKILASLDKGPLPLGPCSGGGDLSRKTHLHYSALHGYLSEMERYKIVRRGLIINKESGHAIRPYILTKRGKELSKLAVELYPLVQELEEKKKIFEEKTESLMGEKVISFM